MVLHEQVMETVARNRVAGAQARTDDHRFRRLARRAVRDRAAGVLHRLADHLNSSGVESDTTALSTDTGTAEQAGHVRTLDRAA